MLHKKLPTKKVLIFGSSYEACKYKRIIKKHFENKVKKTF